MKTLRKALSLALAVMMLLLEVPVAALAADDPPVYQPDYNQFPIFSTQASSNLDQFVGADGNSVFNVVGRFQKTYALGSGYPDWLTFSSSLTGNEYGYYQMGFSDLEKRIAAADQLGVALHAQITNDKHWSVNHLFSTETSANKLKLSSALYSYSSFGKALHEYDSIEHLSSGIYEYTDSGKAFPSTGNGAWQVQGLTLYHSISGDKCGAPSTGGLAVMLADLAAPTVQSIHTTAESNPASPKHERFKQGETIYVHLKFNEAVRLSTDNAANLAGLTLNMAISDIKTGTQVGGMLVPANIVSLSGDTMTFRCVVPASLNIEGQDVTTNHYLSSVKMSDQSWVTANNSAYDLTYVYKDGTGKHTVAPKDPTNNPTLVKASSLITDFAGNPVARSTEPIYFSKPCYMDNVAPTVSSVTPVATAKNANSDFDGTGQTFMTAGDVIEITAEFSEEMQFYNAAARQYNSISSNDPADPAYSAGYRAELLRAELNVKDVSGNPIVVTGKRAVTSSAGVNGVKTTKVTFELTVPSGARPMVYGDTAYALGINRVTVDSLAPYPLCDSRGNPYITDNALLAGPGLPLAPTRQLWLDTLQPVAAMEYIGGGASDFYVKVSVDDQLDGGVDLGTEAPKYRSGTTGMFGTFRWGNGDAGVQDFKYEYAYVSSPSVEPGLRAYLQAGEGETVPGPIQLPGDGLYIHFRLLSDSDYSIVDSAVSVQLLDKAGNMLRTGVGPVAALSIPLVVDTIGPVATRESQATKYVDGHGEIESAIKVKDIAGKVADIQYQWVPWTSDDPPDPGVAWNSALTLLSYSKTGYYSTFTTSVTGLSPDVPDPYRYSLYVRSLDAVGGELPGLARFEFLYDVSKPARNLTFVTSPDGFHAKHSVLFTPGPQKTIDVGGASEDRTPTVIAMIGIPGQPGQYYVKSALMPGGTAAVSAYDDIFGIPSTWGPEASYFEDWHVANVTADVTGGTVITRIADLRSTRGASDDPLPPAHQALQDLMYDYYGDLELRLVAAYIEETAVLDNPPDEVSVTIPVTAITADDTYTLKSAFAGYVWGDCAYQFDVAPILDDGTLENPDLYDGGVTVLGELLNMTPAVGERAGRFGSVQSLSGVKVKVALENKKRPDWGTADLAGIDVTILRKSNVYNEGTGSWGFEFPSVQVYATRLPAVASQVFEVPAGVCDQSGEYIVEMRVVSLAESEGSGESNIWRDFYGYVEKATVGGYGVARVTAAQVEYDYSSDSVPPDEVYLPASGTGSLTFRAEFTPSRFPQAGHAGDNFYTRIYMQLINTRNSATTGWVKMTALPNEDDVFLTYWDPYGYGEVTFAAAALGPAGLGLQDGDQLVYEVMTTTGVPKVEWDPILERAVTTHAPYSPPPKSLIVRMSDAPPVLEMQLEPLTPTRSADGVIATVKALTSPSSPVDSIVLQYRKGAAGASTAFAAGDEIKITENDTYYFFAHDRFGNTASVTKVVDWIDDDAPTLTVVNNSAGNQFTFAVTLDDASPVSLALQHGEDYWEDVLGMPPVATQDDVPRIVVSDSSAEGPWYASAPSESGVYQVTTAVAGTVKTVQIKGAFKFAVRSIPSMIVTRFITFIATDAAGNEATLALALPNVINIATSFSGDSLGPENGLTLAFTAPVILTTPALSPSDTTYEVEKRAVPIFANGNYTIEYADIFGQLYQESIAVDAYDGAYNVDISMSETGPTQSDVVITIDATSNAAATLELPVSDGTMTVVPVMGGDAVKGATITVSQNRNVTFGVIAGGITRPRSIPVTNIDRTAPTATVTWSYTDAVVVNPATGDGETKGEIVASLVASESVVGMNNKATIHRFTFGDQADYVFEYQDDAGNPGAAITASLSSTSLGTIQIVEKTFIDADADAPAYTMAVSQAMPGGAFVKTAQHTQAQYTSALATGNPLDAAHHVTRTLRLSFSVTDVNPTKLFVMAGLSPDTTGLGYNNPATAAISGVSWAGDSVDFTKNVSVTVILVDAKDNMTLIPVTTTKIDDVPPTGETTLVKVDFYRTRAYVVNLADALSATVTVRSAPGVSWDPAYGATGAYYHEFVGNGQFDFTIEDSAGNVATITAVVAGIDETAPAVSKTTWSPSFIGPDEAPVSDAPPEDRVLATNVVARVEFSKPLITDSCAATLLSPVGNASDYFECTWGSNNAMVTFKAAATVKLDFVAQNYTVGTHTLDGTGLRIDRTPPQITVTSDEPLAGSTRSVQVTIVSNEPAWELGSGLAMTTPGGLTVKTNISKNGDYAYRFADGVGNIAPTFTVVDKAGTVTCGCDSLSVTRIDDVAPTISVSGFPDTRAEVLNWNATHGPGDQKTHSMRNTSLNVTVTTDEAGSVAVGNEVRDMAAPGSTLFSVGVNGRYTISATDTVGNKTTLSYTVDCIDKTAPTIVLGAGTLKVKQGMTLAAFGDLLAQEIVDKRVYAVDNIDQSVTPTVSKSLTEVNLGTPGSYSVDYTATDDAGNTTSPAAKRTVLVYDLNTPTIFIQGMKTESRGAMIANAPGLDTIPVLVSMPDPGGGRPTEPVKIYYGVGYRTVGEMKSLGVRLAMTPSAGDPLLGDAALPIPTSGFYTLYLVTQSRVEYITYVYVEK